MCVFATVWYSSMYKYPYIHICICTHIFPSRVLHVYNYMVLLTVVICLHFQTQSGYNLPVVQTHPKQQTLSSNFGTAETLVTANDVWPSFQHNIPVSIIQLE